VILTDFYSVFIKCKAWTCNWIYCWVIWLSVELQSQMRWADISQTYHMFQRWLIIKKCSTL
jgi:hypothetical protein